MNCPSCGAPMHLKPDMDCLKCDYCQSVYFPEKDDDGVRALGETADENCPVCSVPLMHAALAKIRILYCTKCRGMLVRMEVLQALIEELRVLEGGTFIQPAADDRDSRRRILCPHCHGPMEAHLYAGPGNVYIDSCEMCLLNWMDRRELTRMVHAPDETRAVG